METLVQPDQKENIVVPENYRFVEGMLSDESVQQRQRWLLDQLNGQGVNVNLGRVNNMLDAADGIYEQGVVAWEQKTDMAEYTKKKKTSERIRENARKIFGDENVADVFYCKKAIYNFKITDGERVEYWGDAARDIFSRVNIDSTEVDDRADPNASRSPNPVDSKSDREGFKKYLEEKRFIKFDTLYKNATRASERHLCLMSDPDSPFEIPVSNIVSAGAFKSWAGGANREGGKPYEKDGKSATGWSLDVIIDYATRETPLPPLEGVVAFVQPNGLTIFGAIDSNHRTSAAIARGDKFVKVKGEVKVFALDRNFVERPVAPEQVKEYENMSETGQTEETNWNDVFELTESLKLPDNAEKRALELASMTATDLIIMTTLLHSRLAANADQNPTQQSMNIVSPDGRMEMVKPEDRYALYEHASSLIKELASDITPETADEFLERVANIVALTTVIAHSFEDGNGRTARYLAHLINNGAPNNEPDRVDFMRLGANRSFTDVRMGTYIPRINDDMTPQEYLDTVSARDIPLRDKESYKERTKKLFTSPYA